MNEKTEAFYKAVERNGLDSSFTLMNALASDKLGVHLDDIIEDAVRAMERPTCRIRYEKAKDGTERYVFETKRNDDETFGFMCSYELRDDMLHYQALTQVRELIKLGYRVIFSE